MESFENHQSFNRYLSIEGYRVNTSGIKPSVYITEVKLKRTVKELSDINIEDIFDEEMDEFQIKECRERLIARILGLHKWQLMKALDILITEGRIEAITYVKNCKRTDKPTN